MQVTHLTKKDFLHGENSPINKVTPQFVGQPYITSKGEIYLATNLDKKDWIAIQPLIDVSELEDDEKDLAKVINDTLSEVKEIRPYIQKIDSTVKDISDLKMSVKDLGDNQSTVFDIHNIVSETVSLKNYYSIEDVDNLLIPYKAICNDLTRRVKYLETENKISCVRVESISDIEFNNWKSKYISVNLTPSNTTELINYESSNTDVATIEYGLITPVSNGVTSITVTCGKGKTTFKVRVNINEQEDLIAEELINIAEELYPVNGYLNIPFISTVPNAKLNYLVWELSYEGVTLGIGTYRNTQPMPSILFNCSHLQSKVYEGVRLNVKRYDSSVGDFKIVATSNETTFEI